MKTQRRAEKNFWFAFDTAAETTKALGKVEGFTFYQISSERTKFNSELEARILFLERKLFGRFSLKKK